MSALAHQVANALVHGDPRRGNERRHGGHDAVIARRGHHVAGAQNADQFVHVVLVRSQDGHAAELFRNAIGRARIQALRRHQNDEHIPLLAERIHGVGDRSQIMFVGAIGSRTRIVEVGAAIVAFLVCAGQTVQRGLGHRGLHRPLKRIDRTNHQHRSASVPSHLSQNALAILRRARLKGPGGVRTQFGRNAQFAQPCARLLVTRDDQRILAIAAAHLGQQRIHVAGFCAVADGEFVLRRGDAERANHHRGQGIGEFALEHGAFASHHAVVPGHFVRQERRKDIGQMNLRGAFEVAFGAIEIRTSSR